MSAALSESFRGYAYAPPWHEQIHSESPLPDPRRDFGHFAEAVLEKQLAGGIGYREPEMFRVPTERHNEATYVPRAIQGMVQIWGEKDKELTDGEWQLNRNGTDLIAIVRLAEQHGVYVPVDRSYPLRTTQNLRTIVSALETALWQPVAA